MEKNKMKKLLEMLKRHEGEVVTNGRHVAYKCPSRVLDGGCWPECGPQWRNRLV